MKNRSKARPGPRRGRWRGRRGSALNHTRPEDWWDARRHCALCVERRTPMSDGSGTSMWAMFEWVEHPILDPGAVFGSDVRLGRTKPLGPTS
eukprot:6143330-Pyramimonas_sp.AAC.1